MPRRASSASSANEQGPDRNSTPMRSSGRPSSRASEHHLRDEARLVAVVRRADERRQVAPVAGGHEALVVADAGEDVVGEVQDGLRAAVVVLELEDARAGVAVGEAEDVAHVRAPEAVDRLRVVADGRKVAVDRREALHDARLEAVHVLVLVHEHVPEAARDLSERLGVRVEQLDREREQVVVVHQTGGTLVGRRRRARCRRWPRRGPRTEAPSPRRRPRAAARG